MSRLDPANFLHPYFLILLPLAAFSLFLLPFPHLVVNTKVRTKIALEKMIQFGRYLAKVWTQSNASLVVLCPGPVFPPFCIATAKVCGDRVDQKTC